MKNRYDIDGRAGSLNSWPEKDCSLCAKNEPINTDFGHGKDFLARKAAESV